MLLLLRLLLLLFRAVATADAVVVLVVGATVVLVVAFAATATAAFAAVIMLLLFILHMFFVVLVILRNIRYISHKSKMEHVLAAALAECLGLSTELTQMNGLAVSVNCRLCHDLLTCQKREISSSPRITFCMDYCSEPWHENDYRH